MRERKNTPGAIRIIIMLSISLTAVMISFFLGRYPLPPSSIFGLLSEQFFHLPSGLSTASEAPEFALRF